MRNDDMRITMLISLAVLWSPALGSAALSVDVSGVRPGPIAVTSSGDGVEVQWKDERSRSWTARFSSTAAVPTIASIAVEGRRIVEGAQPFYRAETGKRRGGWDAFFDFPPSHPDGTRAFFVEFKAQSLHARSIGDRVEISFDGMRLGIFSGSLRYIFYPGSRLIEQQAALLTNEQDVAYFYDAGLRMAAKADVRSGGNMESHISYFDPDDRFQTLVPGYGSERQPLKVKYRAIAAKAGAGAVSVFPAPHQYIMARDYTTNMGYVWYTSWRGNVSLGIRQLPDDNSPYYPWMNAPPGTEQAMRMFILLDDREARPLLEDVQRYTHQDRFQKLPGYVTFAPHWHVAYTVQAEDKGLDWEPPFERAMKGIGIDAALIFDFHGDGHPADLGDLRRKELLDAYRACRARSSANFLLMVGEEANVYLGGHWGLVFPKPVIWHMDRKPGEPFRTEDPKYGTVYRVNNAQELWDMVLAEHGYVYQTHPRTKGSTGYPDKIFDTAYFRDPHYLGVGWKAMPSDLSSPRLGERSFRTLDDVNNRGFKKRLMGEVDVFQLDTTHELYGHMNINYVRLPGLPAFDNYGQLLDAVARGEYFMSTGEVLIPTVKWNTDGDHVQAHVAATYTFPLNMAEIVWGDGTRTERRVFPLDTTREFGKTDFDWSLDAPGWKWARLAVWDVAGNGAFTNPVWR
jgi:hypothetical protein